MANNKGKMSGYNIHEKLTEVLLELAKTHERNEVFKLVIKYLTSTIDGSGCSIFLVNPSTDELNMVASSAIPKDKWKNCNYKRGEGFTGWVFEQRKLLYIPDEKDEKHIKNIKPEPKEHGKGRKPCETTPIGPFIVGSHFIPGEVSQIQAWGKGGKLGPKEG